MWSSSSNRKATAEGGQLLPFKKLLRRVQQQVARNDAVPALFQSQLNGVTLLAGREEHVRSGQPGAVAAAGILVPGPLARIVVERARQLPDRLELIGKKQPS